MNTGKSGCGIDFIWMFGDVFFFFSCLKFFFSQRLFRFFFATTTTTTRSRHKMSYVHVEDVQVVQPLVAPFLSPIAIDIVFELSQELKDGIPSFFQLIKFSFLFLTLLLLFLPLLFSFFLPDLEWKITYVGSADSEACDQELESVFVGPVPVGKNKFRLEVSERRRIERAKKLMN